MGWPHGPFELPDDVLNEWRAAGSRGVAEVKAWEVRISELDSTQRRDFVRALAGDLADGWLEKLNIHKQKCSIEEPNWATRQASGNALTVLTDLIPE